MSVSTWSWVNGVTLTDSLKEKIRDESVVWNLVKDTFLQPDVFKSHRSKPHRSKKVVLQKRFSSQVGNLGCNGAMCFWVTVIFHKVDQRIITAYPT